ncbi:tRNA epoxyqueuosine(34) reductase QueG [Botrimarina colliarenosi]|nr:tRNA epoxyqueuosine(34) reductase QueG [Botrimarina colliarenosi]
MTDAELTRRLKTLAAEIGFSMAGVTPAVTPPGIARFDDWLAAGYAGDMRYLADRRDDYEHPARLLDGARSVVVLALDYRTKEPAPPAPGQGRVSRYAWGDRDYHDVIRPRLHRLADALREWRPGAVTRGLVDTAPFLERDFAVLAGLGWVGKNTLVLNRDRGSYFFLAVLLTDATLAYDEPAGVDHCGTCTACLDACPTDAFAAPGVLDATRCISYLNIEQRGMPAADLREGIGSWLLGCDVCQDVCPWNHHAAKQSGSAAGSDFAPREGMNPIELAPLFELSDEAFRERFRKTPLWRPKRRGLLRNAALVLGATRAAGAEEALARGMIDEEPLVREASAWALGQIASVAAIKLLTARRETENDPLVQAEIETALQGLSA